MKAITVFGNEIELKDNLAVRLVPRLSKKFGKIKFIIQDPTESLEPVSKPWVILDTAVGIDRVVMVKKLTELDRVKGSSVHDFDVYMDLRLKEKLGRLPKVIIILIPYTYPENKALEEISQIIQNQ